MPEIIYSEQPFYCIIDDINLAILSKSYDTNAYVLNYGKQIVIMFFFFGPVFSEFADYFIKCTVQSFKTPAKAPVTKRRTEIGVPDTFKKLGKLPVGAFNIVDKTSYLHQGKYPCYQGSDLMLLPADQKNEQ
jgi:hypothetical protein